MLYLVNDDYMEQIGKPFCFAHMVISTALTNEFPIYGIHKVLLIMLFHILLICALSPIEDETRSDCLAGVYHFVQTIRVYDSGLMRQL